MALVLKLRPWWRSIDYNTLKLMLKPITILPDLIILTLRRLRSRPGLTLLALLGIVLAVGLLSSTAFFSQAVDRVILLEELARLSSTTGRHPFSTRIYYFPSSRRPLSVTDAETVAKDIGGALSGEIGLPVGEQRLQIESPGMMLLPRDGDTRYALSPGGFLASISFAYIADVATHVEVIDGAPFADAPSADPQTLDVWMHRSLATEMGIVAGEEFDAAVNLRSGRRAIRIAGLWQAVDPTDSFWFSNPDQQLKSAFLISRSDYVRFIEPMLPAKSGSVSWLIQLDDSALNPAYARQYATGFDRGMSIINQFMPNARLDISALDSLRDFVQRQTTLTTTLLSFNVPAMGFLLAFLALIAAIIADWQRRETAILVSRGVNTSTILGLTLLEECVLYVLAVPLGIGFGMWLARMMGYTASFLEFQQRAALPVSLQGLDWRLIAVALLAALLARLIPIFQATRQSVVVQARESFRPLRLPWWQRANLDFLLIIPTWYAYQQLAQRGSLAQLVENRPDELFQDPLLILLPALFVFCAALLSMRLFLVVMRVLDWLAHRMPWTTPHLALRQLSRHGQSYVNPLLLVMVSLALGIYTYSLAASLDQWLVDRIYYSVGSDVSFLPFVESSINEGEAGSAAWIPTQNEFADLDGIRAAGRVGHYEARITASGGQEIRGEFLAIDRAEFPNVAWFRADFSPESLGAMMNRLALADENVLVSQEFLDENLLRFGDVLHIRVAMEDGIYITSDFTIAGVYNYFPTVQADKVTVVGNIEHLFLLAGSVFPHNIWMRTASQTWSEEREEAMFKEIETTGIKATFRQDAQGLIREEKGKFERVGIFGTLSVGFLAATSMAALALLIYSYASPQERLYQFGVMRAIGLHKRQVLVQIVVEYALLISYSALSGLWIGAATSQIFAPFFRITGQRNPPLPPLIPVIAQDKMASLALVFAVIMISIEIVVIGRALAGRLFNALRMGHQG